MNTQALLEEALRQSDEDAVRAIVRILNNQRARPAILATIDGKRYVVAEEDEHEFENIPDGPLGTGFDNPLDRVWFGGRWMRGYGRVDEMYRSLGGYEVTRIQRVDRDKVWGR